MGAMEGFAERVNRARGRIHYGQNFDLIETGTQGRAVAALCPSHLFTPCFRTLRPMIKGTLVLRWRVRCSIRAPYGDVDGLRLGVVLGRVDGDIVVARRKVRVGSR